VVGYQTFRGPCCLLFPHKKVESFKETGVDIFWVVTQCSVVGY